MFRDDHETGWAYIWPLPVQMSARLVGLIKAVSLHLLGFAKVRGSKGDA